MFRAYLVTITSGEGRISPDLICAVALKNISFIDLVWSEHIETSTNGEGGIFPELICSVNL